MCNSRRLFGDLAEWTWGSDWTKWRAFGDLREWTWGSGCFCLPVGTDWALPEGLDAPRIAPYPKKSHSATTDGGVHGAGSPKTLTVV